ncbi:MAG: gamma-glutamyl-gamma-aminobutyrate hydrolase family protein [Acidimicrobiia bacterium]
MAGHVAPASAHIAGDYPELITSVLARADIELVRYDIDQDRFPTSITECDGWLLSPSRCSAYDGHAWIASAEDLLRELIAREHPYVGICFGHQLAAQALGGTVARAADGWQVGVQDYEIVATRPWMVPMHSTLSLIASHEDQVVAVPSGTSLMARSPQCPVAGLLIGERAWTLQPHPEFVPALADDMLAQRIDLIGAEKVALARATLGRPLNRLDVGRWIVKFLSEH